MAIFDVSVMGKKSEIDKLATVCAKVGDFLKIRFGLDEDGEFWDWTGISSFSIFHRVEEYRFRDQVIIGEGSSSNLLEWTGAPWKDDEAAIWWPQIDSPKKFPTETSACMLKEGKRLKIDSIVETLIQEWDKANLGLSRGFGKLVHQLAIFKFEGSEFTARCTRRMP
jgi:hypothetical protein